MPPERPISYTTTIPNERTYSYWSQGEFQSMPYEQPKWTIMPPFKMKQRYDDSHVKAYYALFLEMGRTFQGNVTLREIESLGLANRTDLVLAQPTFNSDGTVMKDAYAKFSEPAEPRVFHVPPFMGVDYATS